MPVTLRKRLQCHYCGKRLNTGRRDSSRVTCESCTADNFFDVHGNITDVPVEEASRSGQNNADQREVASQSDVFCSTCLKNQHMYITALSDYLPDPEDPKYDEIEAALPTFKQQLELRFPQCCAQCEPRVQERLRQANYAAKSDHLRRVLHRNHSLNRLGLGWRSLIITGGGIGYFIGTTVQLVWHAISSRVDKTNISNDIPMKECFSKHLIPQICSAKVATAVPWSLVLTLLCIWWNPKWQHRLLKQDGRLTGLETYYKMQVFILVFRFAIWVAAVDLPALEAFRPQLHAMSLVTIAMFTIWSLFGIVKVDAWPLVNWQHEVSPLVHEKQFVPPLEPKQQFQPVSPERTTAFTLGNLASNTERPSDPWRPPTPPIDDDSMDWTPSQTSFQPQPRKSKHKIPQPSPFYGSLPPLPGRGQSIDEANMKRRASTHGVRPGFFGSRRTLQAGSESQEESSYPSSTMAAPRFFPEASRFETGLENIFGSTFSLSKASEPVGDVDVKPHTDIFGNKLETSDNKSVTQRSNMGFINPQQPSWTAGHFINAVIAILLGFIALSLCVVDFLYESVSVAPSTVLPYIAIIPIWHFCEQLFLKRGLGFTGAFWLCSLACVTGFSNIVLPRSGSQLVPMWNKMVIGIVCLLFVQELFYLCCMDALPLSNTVQAQMAQSISKAEQSEPDQHSNTRALQKTAGDYNQALSIHDSQPQSLSTGNFAQSQQWGSHSNALGRRGSNESLSSVSSIKTTTTASGWQTPPIDHRRIGWQPQSAASSRFTDAGASRMGALSLGNDFSIGSSIAGPRGKRNGGTTFTQYR